MSHYKLGALNSRPAPHTHHAITCSHTCSTGMHTWSAHVHTQVHTHVHTRTTPGVITNALSALRAHFDVMQLRRRLEVYPCGTSLGRARLQRGRGTERLGQYSLLSGRQHASLYMSVYQRGGKDLVRGALLEFAEQFTRRYHKLHHEGE